MLDEILEFNKQFVANKGYEKYIVNNHRTVSKMKRKSNKI